MARIKFVAIAFFALTLAACSSSPIAPNPQPPDQSKFEPLGVPVPATTPDGTAIQIMRVTLASVTPLRGSTIAIGQANCSNAAAGCFESDLTFSFDGIDNSVVGMHVEVYFSADGQTPSGPSLLNFGTAKGSITKHLGPWFFNQVPRSLLVIMSHDEGGASGNHYPAETGTHAFLLDYRQ